MFRIFVSRLLALPVLLFVVLTIVFFLGQASAIDPTERVVGPNATPEQIAAARQQLGLDRPAIEQYSDWMNGLVHGDLGDSLLTGVPVSKSIWEAIPVTLSLTFGALLVAVTIGVTSGTIAALRAGSTTDRVVSGVATAGQALPSFWLGLLLISLFAIKLGWFPAVGYNGPTSGIAAWMKSIALPSISLGLVAAASIERQTRSAMIGVLQQEYIRTALAKGLPRFSVVAKHALKNAAPPVLTVLAFQVSFLLGGSIVVERLFAMPGLGTLAINAVLSADTNMIQAFVLVTVVLVVMVNLLLDMSYMWLNPKVRAS